MAASSAGQYNLNIKNLGALPIPVPSPDVQSSTLARLEEVKQGFGRLSQQLVATKQHASVLRRSLLEAAFSGRLVPQDSGDEQAGVLLERIAADRAVRPTSRRRRTAKEAV
jgi:type I restriction enzyme S subunit